MQNDPTNRGLGVRVLFVPWLAQYGYLLFIPRMPLLSAKPFLEDEYQLPNYIHPPPPAMGQEADDIPLEQLTSCIFKNLM